MTCHKLAGAKNPRLWGCPGVLETGMRKVRHNRWHLLSSLTRDVQSVDRHPRLIADSVVPPFPCRPRLAARRASRARRHARHSRCVLLLRMECAQCTAIGSKTQISRGSDERPLHGYATHLLACSSASPAGRRSENVSFPDMFPRGISATSGRGGCQIKPVRAHLPVQEGRGRQSGLHRMLPRRVRDRQLVQDVGGGTRPGRP